MLGARRLENARESRAGSCARVDEQLRNQEVHMVHRRAPFDLQRFHYREGQCTATAALARVIKIRTKNRYAVCFDVRTTNSDSCSPVATMTLPRKASRRKRRQAGLHATGPYVVFRVRL